MGSTGCTVSRLAVRDVRSSLDAIRGNVLGYLGPEFRDFRTICTVAFLNSEGSYLEEKFLRRSLKVGLDIRFALVTFLARTLRIVSGKRLFHN